MSAVDVPMSSAVMSAPSSPSIARGRLEAGLALVRAPVVDHYRLASAEVEPRRRGLEGHRPREAHDVLERLPEPARIALEAHPAERRPEHRRVHGHDEAQSRPGVLPDDDLLVVVGVEDACGWGPDGPGSNGHGL